MSFESVAAAAAAAPRRRRNCCFRRRHAALPPPRRTAAAAPHCRRRAALPPPLPPRRRRRCRRKQQTNHRLAPLSRSDDPRLENVFKIYGLVSTLFAVLETPAFDFLTTARGAEVVMPESADLPVRISGRLARERGETRDDFHELSFNIDELRGDNEARAGARRVGKSSAENAVAADADLHAINEAVEGWTTPTGRLTSTRSWARAPPPTPTRASPIQ